MSFSSISAGKNLPDDIYVIVEIPAFHAPIKYEVDKDFDCLMVDRFMRAPVFYPANYGYINKTLADDGDPLDALVITPAPVAPGSVIRARPVGILNMSDEAGHDAKLITVPHNDLSEEFSSIEEYTQLPSLLIKQIEYFFRHYKELDNHKWVKINEWGNSALAKQAIIRSAEAYFQHANP
jgi:inorganic pyrophosphatase